MTADLANQWTFKARPDADAFAEWLRARKVSARVRPSLAEYRHGSSPGSSVFWTSRGIMEQAAEGTEARTRGARRWGLRFMLAADEARAKAAAEVAP